MDSTIRSRGAHTELMKMARSSGSCRSWLTISMLGRAVLPARISQLAVNTASRFSLADRSARGSGTGGKAYCTAASTSSRLPAHRRYNAALPVWARAAMPSMVSPPYPADSSSASVAS
ncbi:Uncharacterised protein [Mycobacterium tuberculosis]|nr:Uncharacterised protein [Mycobacterium tuberculosis]